MAPPPAAPAAPAEPMTEEERIQAEKLAKIEALRAKEVFQTRVSQCVPACLWHYVLGVV
jgi:hypothetical protein